MIALHHLVFGRNLYLYDFLYSEINSIVSYLPVNKNGTVTNTTDRKGGNTAIQFGSGYLQTVNNLPASSVWSVSFWVKNTTTDFKVLFSLNNGVTDAKQLQISINAVGNPTITISSPNNPLTNYNQKTFPNTNQTSWNHIVIVFNRDLSDSEEIKLYKNGVLTASSSQGNYDQTGLFQNAKLTIGALYNGQYISNSTMDDVKIFNRPLTQIEITNLYNE